MVEIILITSLSFTFALIISILDKIFKKDENALKIENITNMLPGYNCNACKSGGCSALATLIVNESVDPAKCKPIKKEDLDKIIEYLKK